MKRITHFVYLIVSSLILFLAAGCKDHKDSTVFTNPDWLSKANMVSFNAGHRVDSLSERIVNALPLLQSTGMKIVHISAMSSIDFADQKWNNTQRQLRQIADSLHYYGMKLMLDVPAAHCSRHFIVELIKDVGVDGFFIVGASGLSYQSAFDLRCVADSVRTGVFFAASPYSNSHHSVFNMSRYDALSDWWRRLEQDEVKASDAVQLLSDEAAQLKRNDIRIHPVDTEKPAFKAMSIAFAYTLPGIVELSGADLMASASDSGLVRLVRDLNSLKAGNRGLWSPSYKDSFMGLRNSAPDQVLSYVRFYKKTQVLCLFNFSNQPCTFRITDMLNGEFAVYSGRKVTAVYNANIVLPPMSYSIQVCMN